MTTEDLSITPTPAPKPGPIVPIRSVPARSEGLNEENAERRRRIVMGLLPYVKNVDDLLTAAVWIDSGELLDDTEEGTDVTR